MIKFEAGELVTVGGEPFDLEQHEVGYFRRQIKEMLNKHISGNWGDVCDDRAKMNNQAVKNGEMIVSRYTTPEGRRYYFITDSDRSFTTVRECSPY